MSNNVRVSDEPVYWGLFGFGGMVIAFALPIILVLMILNGLLDINCFGFMKTITCTYGIGAGAVAVIIIGTLWHCFHRIYHGLHDLTIRTTRLHHYVLYGAAFTLSVVACILCLVWFYIGTNTPLLQAISQYF